MTALRFTLADLEHAADTWRCSCGPASLAAICGLTLEEARACFPGFKGWTNVSMMLAAVDRIRPEWRSWKPARDGRGIDWPRYGLARIQFEGPWTAPGANQRWAYKHTHWVGVSRLRPCAVSIDPEVSFGRPVLAGTRVKVAVVADLAAAGESVDAIAREFNVDASTVRDAIAWSRGETDVCIWDCNGMRIGHCWSPLTWWSLQIVPSLTADIPRASGGWHVTHAIEVERP